MAAMLDMNGADGKPLGYPGLPEHEIVRCKDGCPVTFTLAYGQTENRMEGNKNVLDVIRQTASEVVKTHHPHFPYTAATFVWGGTEREWLDNVAAKAAGL